MNALFTGLFTVETVLKLHAYGSRVRPQLLSATTPSLWRWFSRNSYNPALNERDFLETWSCLITKQQICCASPSLISLALTTGFLQPLTLRMKGIFDEVSPLFLHINVYITLLILHYIMYTNFDSYNLVISIENYFALSCHGIVRVPVLSVHTSTDLCLL